MKRLIALVLAGMMVLGGICFAAEWPQGCSAAQPYAHLPEVNLSETMGYIMLYPRTKLPAARFCDTLRMYLPRTDLELGKGRLHLFETAEGKGKPVEVCTVNFADPDSVSIREMTEDELTRSFTWGSGSCVEVHLSKSLEFGDRTHSYYVLMDEGCFTGAEGKLKSISITNHDAWMPAIEGDYGVSGLYYTDAKPVEKPAEEAGAEAAPAKEKKSGPIVVKADRGDKVCFDLVLGGDAKLAVLYSENGSVEFPEIEFTQSAAVEGTVVGDEVQWGVAFFDANGYIFDTVKVGK